MLDPQRRSLEHRWSPNYALGNYLFSLEHACSWLTGLKSPTWWNAAASSASRHRAIPRAQPPASCPRVGTQLVVSSDFLCSCFIFSSSPLVLQTEPVARSTAGFCPSVWKSVVQEDILNESPSGDLSRILCCTFLVELFSASDVLGSSPHSSGFARAAV